MSETERCDVCRFWLMGDPAWDLGICRRHAPRAADQLGAFIGEAIIAVAHILSKHYDVEWPGGIAGEATEANHAAFWPRTDPGDWCGEFRLGPSHD